MLSLGIIGLGGVSRFYVRAAEHVSGIRLVAACDRRIDRLARLEAGPGVELFDDAAELLLSARVDAVVIDTPVASHGDLCRAALTAGKHVCCEKPLALTRAEAAALLELARAQRLVLFTAFHRRYNRRLPQPAAIDPRDVAFAEARYLENIADHCDGMSCYGSSASNGGGCIVDNGPNAYDVVRHLLGEVSVTEAEVVRAAAGVDMEAVVRGQAGDTEVVVRLDWGFEGECKDVRLRMRDGSELHLDMLQGFTGFKSSLEHEYVGVLEDFASHVAVGRSDDGGFAATAWLEDVLGRCPA